MFSLSKDYANILISYSRGRWSSEETSLKYSTIHPTFLTSEGQTKISEMRTLIAFKNFVRNEPPQSHDVRLVTIWPHLISLSSTSFISNSSHQTCVYYITVWNWHLQIFYTRNSIPYFLWIFLCFHEEHLKLSSGHQYSQWLIVKTI